MPDYSAVYKGLSSIGEAFEKYQEEQKNRARQFDALVNYADAAGIAPKDELKVQSLESVEGLIKGKMAKSKLDEDRMVARQRELQIEQLMRQQQADEALANVMAGHGSVPIGSGLGPVATQPPQNADELMAGFGRNKNAILSGSAGRLVDLMRQQQAASESEALDQPPTSIVIDGKRIFYRPKTGWTQMDPEHGAGARLEAQKDLMDYKESKGVPLRDRYKALVDASKQEVAGAQKRYNDAVAQFKPAATIEKLKSELDAAMAEQEEINQGGVKSPEKKKTVRVKGPPDRNGKAQIGHVPEGTKLPAGWSFE